jgi:anaerobic magnesium-protoporphyrin IX monomethyl ester cyclase
VGATFLWDHFLTHFPEIDYVVRGEGEYTLSGTDPLSAKKETARPCTSTAWHFEKRADRSKPETANRWPTWTACPCPQTVHLPTPLADARMPGRLYVLRLAGLLESPRALSQCRLFCYPDGSTSEKGVTFFFVSDDTFTLKRDLVIDICRRIVENRLDITWAAISRVDCVDEEMLGWMRRAGCTQISYGVESGSRKIRDLYHKRISDAAILQAFRLTTRYGIMARAYFIYGAPGETDATIAASLDLIRRIHPLSAIFYILDLFPGTALYEDFKRRSGVNDDIWLERVEDILYFETDERLDRDTVLGFGRRLREGYFTMLPAFAEQLELVDEPDLYPFHADFLSRLALTFSHGDYAANPLVKNSLATAIMPVQAIVGLLPGPPGLLGTRA